MTGFDISFININGKRNAEYFAGILNLINCYENRFFCVIVTIVYIENGMPAPVIPARTVGSQHRLAP